jgi:anti-sigma regulatory factor (Ser/Thr protein kinase)
MGLSSNKPSRIGASAQSNSTLFPFGTTASHAVSIGLIVTELIINAIKYAFPERHASARIRVTFEMAKSDWKLTVADNGAGRNAEEELKSSTGLGTALIGALAKQLKAQITETSSTEGLTVAVARSTFESRLPLRLDRQERAMSTGQPLAIGSTLRCQITDERAVDGGRVVCVMESQPSPPEQAKGYLMSVLLHPIPSETCASWNVARYGG